jgi:hypothetical protein
MPIITIVKCDRCDNTADITGTHEPDTVNNIGWFHARIEIADDRWDWLVCPSCKDNLLALLRSDRQPKAETNNIDTAQQHEPGEISAPPRLYGEIYLNQTILPAIHELKKNGLPYYADIAKELNSRGITTEHGHSWNVQTVGLLWRKHFGNRGQASRQTHATAHDWDKAWGEKAPLA